MTLFWKDMGWYCRSHRPIYQSDLLVLTKLYQPLVGATAYSLYLSLSFQLPVHRAGVTDVHSHGILTKLLGISYEQFLEARYHLEGVGLLNTYELGDIQKGIILEYELIPPLSPLQFFQSEVFNVALYQRVGKEQYQTCRELLIGNDSVMNQRSKVKRNVTKPFRAVYGSVSPHELQKITEIEQEFPLPDPSVREDIQQGQVPVWSEEDFSAIQLRLQSIVHPSVWTDELISQLKEICFLYQLNMWDLLTALQEPYVTQRGEIDIERLKSFVRGEYRLRFGGMPRVAKKRNLIAKKEMLPSVVKETAVTDGSAEEKHFRQLATMSPLELLRHYQGGAQVPESDQRIVEDLIEQYKLAPAVVNVLLDYVMIKYDRKLDRALITKIAGYWKRLGVETMEQARELAKKEVWDVRKKKRDSKLNVKRSKNSLPKSVAMQMEQEQKDQKNSALSQQELEQNRATIQAKIQMMNQKLSNKRLGKENAP